MDKNPARNKKLTASRLQTVADSATDVAEKTGELATSVAALPNIFSTLSANALTNTIGTPVYIAAPSLQPGQRITARSAQWGTADTDWIAKRDIEQGSPTFDVQIAAYAVINGQLYSHTMRMDRNMWEYGSPVMHQHAVNQAKLELARKIADTLVEVYVNGERWVPGIVPTTG